jgi:hypothetical protein
MLVKFQDLRPKTCEFFAISAGAPSLSGAPPHPFFQISESATAGYVAIFHFHLHVVYILRSWFGMQELVRHTINM